MEDKIFSGKCRNFYWMKRALGVSRVAGKTSSLQILIQVSYWHCFDLQFKFGQVRVLVKKNIHVRPRPQSWYAICYWLLNCYTANKYLISHHRSTASSSLIGQRQSAIFKNKSVTSLVFKRRRRRVSPDDLGSEEPDICCDIWIIANISCDQPPSRESN